MHDVFHRYYASKTHSNGCLLCTVLLFALFGAQELMVLVSFNTKRISWLHEESLGQYFSSYLFLVVETAICEEENALVVRKLVFYDLLFR